MTVEIVYHPDTVDDLLPFPQNIKRRIQAAIVHRLGTEPQLYGKPLRGELKSVWSLRVGDYRIIYQLKDKKVIVLQIAHRRDVYEDGVIEVRARGIL